MLDSTSCPSDGRSMPRSLPRPVSAHHHPTVADVSLFLQSIFPAPPPAPSSEAPTPAPALAALAHPATPAPTTPPPHRPAAPPTRPRNSEVPFLYHKPFSKHISATALQTDSVVLSITPTAGFYSALATGKPKLAFLHRPWSLDRRRVPRDVTVLACHKGFDEALTVGANFALARRLGMAVHEREGEEGEVWGLVKGYKGDAERKIGIVGGFAGGGAVSAQAARERVLKEFSGKCEGCFGFSDDVPSLDEENNEGGVLLPPSPTPQNDNTITAIAIMNAFHAAEVTRALDLAVRLNLLSSSDEGGQLLYLTGAVREPGLKFAREKGVRVICVGHRVCEEWGIGFLGERLRERFADAAGLEVREVYEEEEEGLVVREKREE